MSRDLTTQQITATQKTVLQPYYLVEIGFTQPLYGCSGRTVLFNGHTFNQMGLRVGSVVTNDQGVSSTAISIANTLNAFSTLVLSEVSSGRFIKIWKAFEGTITTYTEIPYSEAILIFDGVINEVTDIGEQVSFTCTTQKTAAYSIPNITLGPPYFNFLPRSGQTIVWQGETYELQPR